MAAPSLRYELKVEYLVKEGLWLDRANKNESDETLRSDAEALSATPEKYVYSMRGRRRVSYRHN